MHAYVHDTQFFGPNNRNCCQGDLCGFVEYYILQGSMLETEKISQFVKMTSCDWCNIIFI